MSEIFKIAQKRNWSKYRLMGANFPNDGLTNEECEKINQIKDIEAIVIDDDNRLYTSHNIKLTQ